VQVPVVLLAVEMLDVVRDVVVTVAVARILVVDAVSVVDVVGSVDVSGSIITIYINYWTN